MKSNDPPAGIIREIRFEEDDFFDQEKMIYKLNGLITTWGKRLRSKRLIDKIPDSDQTWLMILEREIHPDDLEDQWDHYVLSCLIFFVLLRDDIRRDFLLQPDNIRGQRLSRWLWRTRHYLTPLSKDVITQFCLCYCMRLERKPIKVRYQELTM